ncbi:hypothetical protein TWF481_005165 [Arthrobotrys musiformis]|uniref:Uncharacterized protein n=1 Tax=Arthrobotrys musiformis TaxID=47236 RepID=A0AAV9WE55_9PEZI
MLSATKLAHLKLTHLHTASNALFLSSPPVSAHISSTIPINASKSNIQLSESTWRKTCAACGYAQVPGLTCSVQARGIGGDPQIGLVRKPEGRMKEVKTSGDVQVPGDTGVHVERDLSRKVRKRGGRTRGARGRREKGESKGLSTSQEPITKAAEAADSVSIGAAAVVVTSKIVKSRKKPKTTSGANKEPRMVYSCKMCSCKTIHSLPKPPLAVSHDKIMSEVSAHGPTSQKSTLSAPLAASTSKPATADVSQRPMTTPVSTAPSSSTNAAAKKRAKSRKNTLSSMLAKEAANRSAATGNGAGGFGFDLMDFMKTS